MKKTFLKSSFFFFFETTIDFPTFESDTITDSRLHLKQNGLSFVLDTNAYPYGFVEEEENDDDEEEEEGGSGGKARYVSNFARRTELQSRINLQDYMQLGTDRKN